MPAGQQNTVTDYSTSVDITIPEGYLSISCYNTSSTTAATFAGISVKPGTSINLPFTGTQYGEIAVVTSVALIIFAVKWV